MKEREVLGADELTSIVSIMTLSFLNSSKPSVLLEGLFDKGTAVYEWRSAFSMYAQVH